MQITKFNEQEHEVTILLQNSSGEFNINPNAIVNLTIEDTLADWVVRGTLSLYQSFDNIENRPTDAENSPPFSFKNDGTDILVVKIFPKFDNSVNLDIDRVHWELVYNFSIYDVEDIDLPPGAQNAASASTKCKKFYFWDRWYQTMITDVMEYSTATSTFAQIPPGTSVTDEQRSLPTGLVLKDIIEKTLLTNNTLYSVETEQPAGGNENAWDDGESKIFYTAPAFATAYDSLMYVYSRHVSSNSQQSTGSGPRGGRITGTLNDFCILTKERGPNEGNEGFLSLRPMSEYFDNAGKSAPGKFQIERFMVQGYAPTDGKEPKAPRADRSPTLDYQDMQIDTKLEQYSLISSYRFVDIAPYTDSTRFISTPVHSFDFLNRTFNIEFQANSVESANTFIRKEYLSKLPTARGPSPEHFLLSLNDRKLNNRNILPNFSLYGYDYDVVSRQADGLQKILKTGIFLNTCINFKTLGSTNRTTGRFIAIDQKDNIDDTDFNNKFFGQWFVINVKHVFEAGIYYNEITAIKIHRFKPPTV
jgi:hypothetical protein